MGPDIDNLVVTFVVRDEPHVVVIHHFIHVVVRAGNQFFLDFRYDDVAQVEREATLVGRAVTEALDVVEELNRLGVAGLHQHVGDDVAQRLLGQQFVDEAVFLRHHAVKDDTAHRRVEQVGGTVGIFQTHLDPSVHIHAAFVVGDQRLFGRIEHGTFALYLQVAFRFKAFGQIIQPQYHVLRRYRDRRTVGRVEDVMRSQHQQLGFQNGRVAERHVNGHLVTVEVGVEGRTYQRVQTHGLTLDEFGLERLNTQTVQGRGTVQQNGVPFHDIFKDVPDNRVFAFHNLLGRFHGLDDAALQQLADDERFEQFGRHVFRQAAFVHLQIRPYDDNRTARIVHTLTQQVLTEAALLTLQTVGKGFE